MRRLNIADASLKNKVYGIIDYLIAIEVIFAIRISQTSLTKFYSAIGSANTAGAAKGCWSTCV